MLKKFLREVVGIVVGKPSEPIADLLNSNKHVNEFVMAKKLGITINQTRNILYRLSDQALVSSIRRKDRKKGWYTYFWKIEKLKTLEFLKSLLNKKIEQLSYQMRSRETKQFYICERCNLEFSEENALACDFTCNECGGIFTLSDNIKILREFKRGLDRLKREKALLKTEIEKEKAFMEKQKEREIKKLEREAAKKRAVKSAQRKAARKSKTSASFVKRKQEKKIVKSKVKKRIAKKKTKKKAAKKKSVKKAVRKKTMMNTASKRTAGKSVKKKKAKSVKKKKNIVKKKVKDGIVKKQSGEKVSKKKSSRKKGGK